MRGATAPSAGSAKCGSSSSSQPGPGTQSESRNATSGVSANARPVFLAAAGPPLTGRRTTPAPAPAAAATLWIAAGSREPSSTTITRGPPVSPARHRASSAWRSRTGTTTVTPCSRAVTPGSCSGPWSSNGWAIPVSSRRRASARAFGLPDTGVPYHQPATCRAPAGLSRSTRMG